MREKFCQVSYTRQLERGMLRPGYAGLTSDRFGDAEVFQPLPASTKEDIQQAGAEAGNGSGNGGKRKRGQ